MKSGYQKILVIIAVVLYVVLLPWPVYVILPYVLFSGDIKYVVLLSAFVIEYALGIFLLIRQYGRIRALKTTWSKINFGLVAVSLIAYSYCPLLPPPFYGAIPYLIGVYNAFMKGY